MITTVLYLISIIGIAILSLFTYARRTERGGIYFSLMSFVIAIWLFCQFLATQYPDAAYVITVIGLIIFSFIPFFFYKFTFFFINPKTEHLLKHQIVSYACLIIMLIAAVLPGTIKKLSVEGGSLILETGPAYIVQTVVALGLILYCFVKFISSFRKFNISKKQATKNLVYGIIVALIGNLMSGLVLADNSAVQFVGPLSILIMSAFATYSITKHSLFDIRAAAARTVAYSIMIFAFVAVFTLFTSSLSSGLIEDSSLRNLVNGILLMVLVLVQKPVKDFLDKVTNSIFFRDIYDPETMLNDLGKILAEQIDLETIMHASSMLIADRLKTKHAKFIVMDESHAIYKTNFYGNIDNDQFPSTEELEMFQATQMVIDDGLRDGSRKSIMKKYNIGLFVKLETVDEVVGYLLLGPKLSGSGFIRQDIRLIEIASKQLAIAVQNARYFAQISEFNDTLQAKIKVATDKLEKTNEKLKELDSAKDEFISMASHQLRTPLTTVKGYLSMVLEGDAGKISKSQHEFLDQAYGSAQRMVYLIADLLNVSRLSTGKFVIDAKASNLAQVVEQEIDQLQRHAQTRNVTLKYEKPKTFPMLELDETKIRQVIMNFTDNAIYYTPSGGTVTAQLEKTPKSIQFTVTDTGIGVPKALQHKLFTKFYRAENAMKARPDGTGLGLFMAKKVIVAQGGSIIFSSVEGKGSTFGFSFPIKKLLSKGSKK